MTFGGTVAAAVACLWTAEPATATLRQTDGLRVCGHATRLSQSHEKRRRHAPGLRETVPVLVCVGDHTDRCASVFSEAA